MAFVKVDAGNAGIEYLFEKLPEIRPPFMINEAFRDEPGFKPKIKNADAQIYILAKPQI